jgi:hypothetical protein
VYTIVLFAESRRDLQRMMDVVADYSKKWRFEVNAKKTEVVVFGAGGSKEQHPFAMGDNEIKVTEKYKYLGMMVDRRGGWKEQKQRMCDKARRRLCVAWSMALRSGQLSVGGGVRIWQALVRPVLEYGAEVWESERDCKWIEAERIQLLMGKRILACSKSMCDEVVRGELGWWSMRGRRLKLRIGFWGKMVSMRESRKAKQIYKESRRRYVDEGDSNWASYTHAIMKEVGLEEEWQQEEVGDLEGWKDLVHRKVEEWEKSRWRQGVASKRKLRTYARLKEELGFEQYLNSPNIKGRRHMTRLRGGSNCLRIERGRWERKAVEERVCLMCNDGRVEDEEHFMLDCALYEDLRKPWLEKMKANYGVVGWGGEEARRRWVMATALGGSGAGARKVEERHKQAMVFVNKAMARRQAVDRARLGG